MDSGLIVWEVDAIDVYLAAWWPRERTPLARPAIVCPRCGVITFILAIRPDNGRECLDCMNERLWK